MFLSVKQSPSSARGLEKTWHWETGPFSPQNGLQSYWRCDWSPPTSAMEETSMSRRKVWQWALQSLLWWTTSTWSSLRSLHWRRHQPDPGCGRGMLMTLSASSGRAQPKNSSTISVGSDQPSSHCGVGEGRGGLGGVANAFLGNVFY